MKPFAIPLILALLAVACWPAAQAQTLPAQSVPPIPLVAAPPGPDAGADGLRYRTSWLGNSFGQGFLAWVQLNATALHVAPDGTCYTNSKWDEGHHAAGIYRDGKVIGTLADMPESGGVGGWAVTGDGQYIYASVSPWGGGQFLRRFLPDGSRSKWNGPGGPQDQIVVSAGKDALITAAWTDPARSRLFVSVRGDDLVKIYDTHDLAAAPRQFALARPGRGAAAPDGTLWVIQEGGPGGQPPRVRHLSAEGQSLPQIIGAPGWSPTALLFDGRGRLLVADNGPDQQVKIYTDLQPAAPQPAAAYGQSVYSGVPGQITEAKWGSSGLVGIGLDAHGNVYAILNGADIYNAWDHGMGLVIESRRPDGALNWRLLGLEFVDGADVDTATVAGNTLDVYTKDERFTLDLSKTAPGAEWTYTGRTANPFKYPTDERYTKLNDNNLHVAAPWVRNFAGGKFLFVSDMQSAALRVYRFHRQTDGETAIPCATFTNDALWRDANGDGIEQPSETVRGPGMPGGGGVYVSYWVDARGDFWQTYNGSGKTGLRHLAMQGLDEHGVPRWDYAHVQVNEQPAPFDELYRAVYLADSDTMYLTGYARGIDPAHHYGGPGYGTKWLGSVMARYDHWSQGDRRLRWAKALPDYNPGPIALSIAGDFVFVGYAHFGDNANSGRIRVFRAGDGALIGSLHAGPEVNGVEGTMDVPYGVNAYRRQNGEYLIFSEDDWFAKVLLYRWTPAAVRPAVPAVQARGGNTVAAVTWNAMNAGRYVVSRATAAAGPYEVVHEGSGTSFVDTGLSNQTPYYYTVRAVGAWEDSVRSAPASVVPSAGLPLRINTGGEAAGDFLADIYASGGDTLHVDTAFQTGGVDRPAPQEVYRSVRRHNCTYTIPGQTPGRMLKVRLHFGEWWFAPGGRKIDVAINGKPVLAGFDVAAAVGKGSAVVREVEAAPDASGQLKIEITSPGEAMISGIEICPPGT